MKVRDIVEVLKLEVYSGDESGKVEISGGYVSDLLSDVMGHANEGEIWITLQSHVNVVAIASLKELAAIILVNGIVPDEAMLKKAREEGVVVLGTDKSTYEITGLLFKVLEG